MYLHIPNKETGIISVYNYKRKAAKTGPYPNACGTDPTEPGHNTHWTHANTLSLCKVQVVNILAYYHKSKHCIIIFSRGFVIGFLFNFSNKIHFDIMYKD